MNTKLWLALAFLGLCLTGCKNDSEVVDVEKPKIDLSKTFPTNCKEVQRGVPFVFKSFFSDNQALASYSLDIHNNFDHHTHSTEVLTDCTLEPKKKPVKPFSLIKTYTIPNKPKAYAATQTFTIPKTYDGGDYHFMIKVTDHKGWTTLKGISFKVK